jgi:hypothetical protein
LLKLNIVRDENKAFNVFQAQIEGKNVTTIRGDRFLHHQGDVAVVGAFSVRTEDTAALRKKRSRVALAAAGTAAQEAEGAGAVALNMDGTGQLLIDADYNALTLASVNVSEWLKRCLACLLAVVVFQLILLTKLLFCCLPTDA